jgi:hypothetical protein
MDRSPVILKRIADRIMKRSLIPYLAFSLLLVFLISADRSFAKENPGKKKEFKPPDHIFTLDYLYNEGEDQVLHGAEARFFNNFNPGEDVRITNIFSFRYLHPEFNSHVPENLYSFSNVTIFRIRRLTLFLGVSHNTDVPFSSIHEFNLNLGVDYKVLVRGGHSLSVGVFYSSVINRNIDLGFPVPFPYVGYEYKGPKLSAMVGYMNRVYWRPIKYINILFLYRPIMKIHFEFQVKPLPFIILSTVYDTGKKYYFLYGRGRKNERLFHDRHLVGERLEVYTSRFMSLFFLAAFQFQGSWYYGDRELDLYEGSARSVYRMGDSFFMKAGVRFIIF